MTLPPIGGWPAAKIPLAFFRRGIYDQILRNSEDWRSRRAHFQLSPTGAVGACRNINALNASVFALSNLFPPVRLS
jgi:hypothetical protein